MFAPKNHTTSFLSLLGLMAGAAVLVSSAASADEPFQFSGRQIHPACVHSLAMEAGDKIPVTTAVSLEGCMASDRAKAEPTRADGFYLYEDEATLGEGSFGYREISRLDNGLIAIAIIRRDGSGNDVVSVAAVDLVERPMLRGGEVQNRKVLEMIGEAWVDNIDIASMSTTGNVVNLAVGTGNRQTFQTIDLSRIGKARDRKK